MLCYLLSKTKIIYPCQHQTSCYSLKTLHVNQESIVPNVIVSISVLFSNEIVKSVEGGNLQEDLIALGLKCFLSPPTSGMVIKTSRQTLSALSTSIQCDVGSYMNFQHDELSPANSYWELNLNSFSILSPTHPCLLTFWISASKMVSRIIFLFYKHFSMSL